MSIRFKLLIVFFVFGIAPMILLSIFNYLSGVRAVEKILREEAEHDASQVARHIERMLRARDAKLLELARAPALRDYVRRRGSGERAATAAQTPVLAAARQQAEAEGVRAEVEAFFLNHRPYYKSVWCVNAGGELLFRVAGARSGRESAPDFQTGDFFAASATRFDEGVWTIAVPIVLRSPVTPDADGAGARATVPIFVEGEARARGALIAEEDFEALCEETAAGLAMFDSPAAAGGGASPVAASRIFIVLDRAGRIIHHTSDALKHQTIAGQMPYFAAIAGQMAAGASGSDFYEATNGESWLAAYRPIEKAGFAIAVARNYSEAAAEVKGTGLSGIALSTLAALAATILLALIARRAARRIELVAAGAAAIAGGELDQRIEVRSSDETRVLAESFNKMSDRLREHITREAETRQFESFMRLSAMLTHDLKNAIAGLSMLVNNMERQFHRAEFRADAILSLREATDKLRRLVARLSEPVKSLSGEYRRSVASADLVPIIKRVLAATIKPLHPLFEVKINLPESLVATVEAERIENVIENLIINAMEAMGASGGRLTVEAGADEPGLIYFSITDTGVGMSEDFLRERLFRAFATTKTKGIGLGLYTCREIVEAHGGRLDVDSQLGVGTRFRVVLPSTPFARTGDSRGGHHHHHHS